MSGEHDGLHMSKTRWVLIAVLAGVGTSALIWRPPLRMPLNKPKAERLLETRLPRDMTLGPTWADALDALRAATGLKVVVPPRTYAAVQLKGDARVSVEVGGKSVGEALNALLRAADERLRFLLDGNGILVVVQEDISLFVHVRVYDVRDFVSRVPDFDNAPAPPDPDRQLRLQKQQAARDRQVEALIARVSSSVPPTPDQKYPIIRELSGQLIVTHTPQGHALVAYELDVMRWRRDARAFVIRAMPTTATFVLGALVLRRIILARRGRGGLCDSCGYDLRATPHRCPECGAVSASPPLVANSHA